MKTVEMEVALMQYFNIRQNLIVPNVSWGLNLHECDLLCLSKENYATEIEIKISRSDLLKDKEKLHNHCHNYISQLYFAVPEILQELALVEIPERSGLLIVKKNPNQIDKFYVEVIRKPKRNPARIKWSEKEKFKLARLGALRILGLKKKIINLQCKN